MSTRILALIVTLAATPAVLAAPVPPERLVTAEAVLKPVRGGPRELAAKLVSAPLLAAVLRSRGAVMTRLAGGRDPAGWLSARLRTSTNDSGAVTLRLVDCPRRDAVALLAAVVDAYKAELLQSGRVAGTAQYERAVLIQALVAQQQNGAGVPINIKLMELGPRVAGDWPSKAETDRSVLQPPRVVQAAVPVTEGPGSSSRSGRPR